MKKKDLYVVRSLRLMEELVKKGFSLHHVEDSKDNPFFKVFMFESTPELHKEITKFSNR